MTVSAYDIGQTATWPLTLTWATPVSIYVWYGQLPRAMTINTDLPCLPVLNHVHTCHNYQLSLLADMPTLNTQRHCPCLWRAHLTLLLNVAPFLLFSIPKLGESLLNCYAVLLIWNFEKGGPHQLLWRCSKQYPRAAKTALLGPRRPMCMCMCLWTALKGAD